MKVSELATQKANSYIHAEALKSAKDAFVKKNSIHVANIRTPFNNTINYYVY